MGEARYYIKATFKTNADAERALPKVKALIEQGIQAEHYWQDHRNMEKTMFWKEFLEKFPTTYAYLGNLAGGGNNNELAGAIEFGWSADEVDSLRLVGRQILYDAEVWHLASWDEFANHLKTLGAKRVNWTSDEYMNPYDTL